MKKIVFLIMLIAAQGQADFYAGAGLTYHTIDETFHSKLHTNENRSGKDRYDASLNRLAPVVQLGYQFPFCEGVQAGFLAEWKYLNYKTPNVNSSRGQILPNASFSSINIFGPEVIRDFTSKTRANHEVLLLGYVGKELGCGYGYLGLGDAFLSASNRIFVTSVHTPNGVGDHLISTSVKNHKLVWGGAIRAGYEYFITENSFINISYTYLKTGKSHLNRSVNTAILNGFNIPGPTTLFLKRSIKFTVQDFMLSLNILF